MKTTMAVSAITPYVLGGKTKKASVYPLNPYFIIWAIKKQQIYIVTSCRTMNLYIYCF